MTENDLKHLSRKDLLEVLIEQQKENERLKAELNTVREKLADREITIQRSGTMAEAVLLLNGIMESADKAAAQYLENAKKRAEEEAKEYLERLKADPEGEKAAEAAEAEKASVLQEEEPQEKPKKRRSRKRKPQTEECENVEMPEFAELIAGSGEQKETIDERGSKGKEKPEESGDQTIGKEADEGN